MGNSLYSAGNSHAKSLAKGGKVTKPDSWSKPSADSENSYIEKNGIEAFGKWHLGIDESVDKQTKGAYKYIFTSDFKNVDRAGIIAIKQRAGGQGDEAILNAAGKILDMIDNEAKSFNPNDLVESIKSVDFFEVKSETLEVLRDEHAIVHFITTPDKDRGGDTVNPHGMNDEGFAKSPSVWYNHNYVKITPFGYESNPNAVPIGKSLWRKTQKDGVLAKTQFNNLPFSQDIYSLHISKDINTWSIGWLPDEKKNALEYDEQNNLLKINYWIMTEYSSAPIAMNPNALDQIKRLKSMEFKSPLMKEIVDKFGLESSIKEQLNNFRAELDQIVKHQDELKRLIESKDDSHIEQMQNEILELKNLINKQKEQLTNETKKITLENLGDIDKKDLQAIISNTIAGEFRRLRGRE